MASKHRYKNWVAKQIENHQWIHVDKKSRGKWRTRCWLIYLAIFIIFCGCAIMFAFAGCVFDETDPSQYKPIQLDTNGAIALLAVGIILFMLDAIIGIYFAFLLPQIYKESQALYMDTKPYLNKRIHYMQADLSGYDKKDIKWLYKLKYIDSAKYESELRRIRQEKEQEKIKHQKSK